MNDHITPEQRLKAARKVADTLTDWIFGEPDLERAPELFSLWEIAMCAAIVAMLLSAWGLL